MFSDLQPTFILPIRALYLLKPWGQKYISLAADASYATAAQRELLQLLLRRGVRVSLEAAGYECDFVNKSESTRYIRISYNLNCPLGRDLGTLVLRFDKDGKLANAFFDDPRGRGYTSLPQIQMHKVVFPAILSPKTTAQDLIQRYALDIRSQKIIKMALASQFEEIHAEQSAKGTSDLCSFYSEQFLSAASLTPPVPYRIEINTVSARFRLHTPWDRALVLEYRVYLNDAPICRSVLYYDFRGRFDDIVIKRE